MFKSNSISYKILVGICSIAATVALVYLIVWAGTIDSPGDPASAGRMYTLENIYDYLTDVDSAVPDKPTGAFATPDAGPAGTMYTLDDIFAKLVRLPATGQTTSYPLETDDDRDDGYYESGATLLYADNNDGTITDSNTKLMWVKQPELIIPGATGVHSTNQIQVARGNWATSTVYNLGDLVRDATGANASAMNISAATAANPCVVTVDNLQGVTTGQSVLINNIVGNMGTDILNGNIFYVKVNATTKKLTLYSNAACTTGVSTTGKTYTSGGTAIQTKFYVCSIAHTSGTFTTDVAAGDWRETVWTASAANLTTPSIMAWLPTGGSTDAINNCENLTYAGHTDWRLPNIKELQSIVNYGTSSPAITTAKFPNTQSGYYWSSTTYADPTGYAWYVRFLNGDVFSSDKTSNVYVRCVRQ